MEADRAVVVHLRAQVESAGAVVELVVRRARLGLAVEGEETHGDGAAPSVAAAAIAAVAIAVAAAAAHVVDAVVLPAKCLDKVVVVDATAAATATTAGTPVEVPRRGVVRHDEGRLADGEVDVEVGGAAVRELELAPDRGGPTARRPPVVAARHVEEHGADEEGGEEEEEERMRRRRKCGGRSKLRNRHRRARSLGMRVASNGVARSCDWTFVRLGDVTA